MDGNRGFSLPTGTQIVRWFDRSGQGHNAVSTSVNTGPQVFFNENSLIGGRPALRFQENLLEAPGVDVRPEAHPQVTAFVVALHDSGGAGQVVWVQRQNGFRKRQQSMLGNQVDQASVSTVAFDAVEASATYWIDGKALGDQAAEEPLEPAETGIAFGALLYPGLGAEGAYFNDLVLAEVLIYQRALSAEERAQVEAYLINKWEVALQDRFWYRTVDTSGLMGSAPVHIDLN